MQAPGLPPRPGAVALRIAGAQASDCGRRTVKLRLVTWNINSIRLRIDNVRRLVAEWAPDVLCLQETKTPDELFPREAFEALGYRHMLVHGMKGYNGVAILSRIPFAATTTRSWCARTDCRHAVVELAGGTELHNIYVPAGGDIPDPDVNPKFAHKLQFLDELTQWFAAERGTGRAMIAVGDLNIAPLETDVWSHKQLLSVGSLRPRAPPRPRLGDAATGRRARRGARSSRQPGLGQNLRPRPGDGGIQRLDPVPTRLLRRCAPRNDDFLAVIAS